MCYNATPQCFRDPSGYVVALTTIKYHPRFIFFFLSSTVHFLHVRFLCIFLFYNVRTSSSFLSLPCHAPLLHTSTSSCETLYHRFVVWAESLQDFSLCYSLFSAMMLPTHMAHFKKEFFLSSPSNTDVFHSWIMIL